MEPAPIISIEDFVAKRDGLGKIVCTSGGFDPIHPGHVSCILESKKYGDTLVVVVNGDTFLKNKKGKAFMDINTRCQIVSHIGGVDYVVPFEIENDQTVCVALAKIKPHIFTKGGDRIDATSIPEWNICKVQGTEIISGVGWDKLWSSSDFLREWGDFCKAKQPFMKLYRFSPIYDEYGLINAVQYVATASSELCRKVIGEVFPITSLTVMSHYPDEFEYLKTLLSSLGEYVGQIYGPRVRLYSPIVAGIHTITHLRIREPDSYRAHVGSNDYDIPDYATFKNAYLEHCAENLHLIKRPEYEMIEFSDPDFDVLGYVLSEPERSKR